MKALICLLKIHLYSFVVPGVWGGGLGVEEATNVTCSCPEGEGIAEGFRAGLGRFSPISQIFPPTLGLLKNFPGESNMQ